MKPCGPHTALWRLLAATNNLNIGMFNLNFDMKSGRARFSRRRARRGASKGSRTSRTWTGSSLASSAPPYEAPAALAESLGTKSAPLKAADAPFSKETWAGLGTKGQLPLGAFLERPDEGLYLHDWSLPRNAPEALLAKLGAMSSNTATALKVGGIVCATLVAYILII